MIYDSRVQGLFPKCPHPSETSATEPEFLWHEYLSHMAVTMKSRDSLMEAAQDNPVTLISSVAWQSLLALC